MATTPIKIKINTIEALERLIGGDSGIEVELRNSVVKGFANRHLRTLAKEILDNGTVRDIKTAIQKEVVETVSVPVSTWHRELREVLRKPIQEAIQKHIKDVVAEEIAATALLAKAEISKQVAERFEAIAIKVESDLKPLIAEGEINKRVKAKLASL